MTCRDPTPDPLRNRSHREPRSPTRKVDVLAATLALTATLTAAGIRTSSLQVAVLENRPANGRRRAREARYLAVTGPGRRRILLIAVAVLLTGCGAAPAGTKSVSAAPTTVLAATPRGSASVGPSDSAKMICGIDVRSQVSGILHLSDLPPTTSSWADQVYTCVYHLAAGPLTVSVQESADTASAGAYFNASLQHFAANRQLSGLGQLAYTASTGSVVVLKDNKTLRIDVTALPSRLGRPPVQRTDLASELAVAIMGCWTGA